MSEQEGGKMNKKKTFELSLLLVYSSFFLYPKVREREAHTHHNIIDFLICSLSCLKLEKIMLRVHNMYVSRVTVFA
jgi:hypothetical protein